MMVIEFLLAILVLAAIFMAVIMVTHKRRSGLDAEYYKKAWAQIINYVGSGESGWRLAIIDADKLLDHALKQAGAGGETMGERLRDRQSTFTHYNQLWNAHKLRNRIVHEPNVRLSKMVTQQALQEFKRALKQLGAL